MLKTVVRDDLNTKKIYRDPNHDNTSNIRSNRSEHRTVVMKIPKDRAANMIRKEKLTWDGKLLDQGTS